MRARLTLPAALVLFVATVGHAAPPVLFNPGFEEVAGSLPRGWTAGAGGTVRLDRTNPRGGAASVLLEATAPSRVTLASEEVALEVGRAYRLTAFVRTEKAVSDPLARYPTAVPAALTMASFPFTTHSPAVGATRDWTRVTTVFVATKSRDRVRLHLGLNGEATGRAWFDDVTLSEVADISELIPRESVRWSGEGYRYDDHGWIFVHVEGEPYERGRQFGALVADELVAYARKLGVVENGKDPTAGWNALRSMADVLFLRKFDEEYLAEMKGIADGAAKAGAKLDDGKRPVDLLDVVTLNSSVDLDYARSAIRTTPHALSGRSFLSAEEETKVPDGRNKCSSFAATGPATADGRVVFGQIFMWAGYTGVHFNVLLDVVPTSGHRLVYQTFPGGIHSGTDFYMNAAGLVIGETTVAQTPFDPDGTPQSNRIRKAAQYASSIDDVARILRERNNGLYTNDWPIADVKRNEVAILLLGTRTSKLWRSSEEMSPFGAPGFFWANNNARDPGVRMEYAVQPDDAPFDLPFSPMNRDVAFRKFYAARKGTIDSIAAVDLFASSPVNRPHACDGKVTTAEMAERLVFLAHQGKTTQREKVPAKESRRMPDLPGAVPHLTYGYAVASPIWITEKLKAARASSRPDPGEPRDPKDATDPKVDLAAVPGRYAVERSKLWKGTIVPATPADAWLASGGAAYWQLLHGLPDEPEKAYAALAEKLGALNARYLTLVSREGDLTAKEGHVDFDRYGPYAIPRIRGTFALHQLRLELGNETFLALMRTLHERYRGKSVSTTVFLALARESAGRDVSGIVSPWLDRTGLPAVTPRVSMARARSGGGWTVRVAVASGAPFRTSLALESAGAVSVHPVTVDGKGTPVTIDVKERPTRALFNPGCDVPVEGFARDTLGSFAEDWDRTLIVHGTSRHDEANRTLAFRWQLALGDAVSEVLPRVVKDSEVTEEELASHDLFLIGPPADNTVTARLASSLPVSFGTGLFTFERKTYVKPDDAVYAVVPNPLNPARALHVLAANGPAGLWDLTRSYVAGMPSWFLMRGGEVKGHGFPPPAGFAFELPPE